MAFQGCKGWTLERWCGTFGPAIRGMPDRRARPLSEPVTLANYGRVSDALRRDLRVAQVICLSA